MSGAKLNKLSSIAGYLFWIAILPVVFIVKENLLVILPCLFFFGVALIYFKNNDLIALTKRAIDRISK